VNLGLPSGQEQRINIASGQRTTGVEYPNDHTSILNVEGSIIEEIQDESARNERNDGSHSIEELQRI
jgi:hypothetical protein